MNENTEIIAQIKTKGNKSPTYKIILEQESNILERFDTLAIDSIDFTDSDTLKGNEWFFINDFSKKKFFIKEYSPVSRIKIENKDYKDISAIIVIQNDQQYFQRITDSRFIKKKTVLDYSGDPKIIDHKEQIEIKKDSDAIHIIDTDILYFKNIGKLKTIFSGIEELYREATQDEVDAFLANECISLVGIKNTDVKDLNRKLITSIGLKYNKLTDEKKQQLLTSIKQNNAFKDTGVKIKGDSFVIECPKDLKHVLYALDERYFKAEIHEENRLASAVRIV